MRVVYDANEHHSLVIRKAALVKCVPKCSVDGSPKVLLEQRRFRLTVLSADDRRRLWGLGDQNGMAVVTWVYSHRLSCETNQIGFCRFL
jgi:hypothetical protein